MKSRHLLLGALVVLLFQVFGCGGKKMEPKTTPPSTQGIDSLEPEESQEESRETISTPVTTVTSGAPALIPTAFPGGPTIGRSSVVRFSISGDANTRVVQSVSVDSNDPEAILCNLVTLECTFGSPGEFSVTFTIVISNETITTAPVRVTVNPIANALTATPTIASGGTVVLATQYPGGPVISGARSSVIVFAITSNYPPPLSITPLSNPNDMICDSNSLSCTFGSLGLHAVSFSIVSRGQALVTAPININVQGIPVPLTVASHVSAGNPATIPMLYPGGPAQGTSSPVTIVSTTNWPGTTLLSVTSNPAGISCSGSLASLSCRFPSSGNYSVTVRAQSGTGNASASPISVSVNPLYDPCQGLARSVSGRSCCVSDNSYCSSGHWIAVSVVGATCQFSSSHCNNQTIYPSSGSAVFTCISPIFGTNQATVTLSPGYYHLTAYNYAGNFWGYCDWRF